MAKGRLLLDGMDRAYASMLDDVQLAVGRLNQRARANAHADIAESVGLTAGSALLTVVVALLFGLLFAHWITTPLRGLGAHARRIAESGELKPLPDSAICRSDELGALSRSFNVMIHELVEARRRLVAQSEEEIRKQFERLDAAINHMPQGLCMIDAAQKLIICNRQYREMYDIADEGVAPGTPVRRILEHHLANGTCPQDVTD